MSKTKTTGQKVTAGLLLAGTALAAWSSPAMGEGVWSGHIGDNSNNTGGWLTGTTTRTWHDNHNDNAATTFGLSECHNEFVPVINNATFQLEEHYWAVTINRGAKTFQCTGAGPGTKSYGEQTSADFHLTLTQMNGSSSGPYRLHAQDVKTKY